MPAFDARLFGRVSELLLDVWLKQNNIKYVETGFVQIGDENWGKKLRVFCLQSLEERNMIEVSKEYDYLLVGAGLFSATFAYQAKKQEKVFSDR